MSLWSGVIGLIFAGLSLFLWFRGVEQWKWFAVAGVVSFVVAPYAALVEEHNLRLELQKVRPHVLIEGVPAATIRAYASRVPGNQAVPEAAYLPGWIMGKASNSEVLMYNVTNGEGISARGMKHFCRIKMTDALGLETDVRLPEQPNKGEVLVPRQSVTRQVVIPDGTFYPGEKGGQDICIVLLVTYLGQQMDENLYFYRVVLRTKQFTQPAGSLIVGLGNVYVESSNEGVVTNLNDLLRGCRG
jgi:hypothetical protein